MTLTKLLIWSHLALVTGYAAPVVAQELPERTSAWIEITATNCLQTNAGPWDNYPCTLTPGHYDVTNVQTHWSNITRTRDCFFGNPPVVSIIAFDGTNTRQLAVPPRTMDQAAAGLPNPAYWDFRFELDYSGPWSSYPCPLATETGYRRHLIVLHWQHGPNGWELGNGAYSSFWFDFTEPERGLNDQSDTGTYTMPMCAYPDCPDLDNRLIGDIDGFDLRVLRSRSTVAVVTIAGDTMAIRIGSPPASADFNRDGVVNVPDVFAFLSAWFAGDIRAARSGDAACEFEDIAIYLGQWFAGV